MRHILTSLTEAFSFPVEHRPQTTSLHASSSVLYCRSHLPPAAPEPAVHISFSRSLSRCSLVVLYFCGLAVSNVRSACLAMMSAFLLNECPSHYHFLLLLSWVSMGSWPVCLHNSLLVALSGQCIRLKSFVSIC